MNRISLSLLGLVIGCLAAGCRTATKVTQMPRVDLELSGGNRGYLVGAPPQDATMKTTREMVETTVEVPSFYKPKRHRGPVSVETPDAIDMGQMPVPPEVAGTFETYVVQKGDSLWSIASKPEVYGKASQWRRLFEANRELLKGSPDRLRPGMTLQVPREDDGTDDGTTYSDEDVTYKK